MGKIVSVLAGILLILFLFWPIKEEVTVTGFSWNRTITIEEERTVKEEDWSVPYGARIYDEKWEFKEYTTVIDHYETITEEKSRQVVDHYDTKYVYTDNGNGTFTEDSYDVPVYATEYYTETTEVPVYKQEAVYDTKYYYEIDKWFVTEDYQSSGNDKNPYWNDNYILQNNESDTKRNGIYYVEYDNQETKRISFDEWNLLEIGDGFLLTKNRLGLIYSKEAID